MVTKKYAIDFHMSDGSVKTVEFEVPQADLDRCVLRDGSNPMTADLPMGGHRVTGLGEPVADGNAVPLGYANRHFAPAGYGLGGVSQRVDSADDATQSGFYQAPVFPETGGGGQMFGYVSKSEDDWLTQIWHYVGLTIKRDKQGGVWKPLEWFNPPMVLGVLYRTTKRCEGKPVYAIRVDCGALPNDTVTNTPLYMSVAEYGADVKLVGIDYTVKHPDTAKPHHIGNPSYIDGVPMNCRLYSNGALYYCRFQTHGDLSAYTAVATLELILGG